VVVSCHSVELFDSHRHLPPSAEGVDAHFPEIIVGHRHEGLDVNLLLDEGFDILVKVDVLEKLFQRSWHSDLLALRSGFIIFTLHI